MEAADITAKMSSNEGAVFMRRHLSLATKSERLPRCKWPQFDAGSNAEHLRDNADDRTQVESGNACGVSMFTEERSGDGAEVGVRTANPSRVGQEAEGLTVCTKYSPQCLNQHQPVIVR
jgi:hypothetical protein